MSAEETRAVLYTFLQVSEALWPGEQTELARRATRWASAPEAELRGELDAVVRQSSRPGGRVRLFWKTGPQLVFAGCNDHFARDAGMGSPAELVGLDDFDRRLPWRLQAAKYRSDDKKVFDSGVPELEILERQVSSEGVTTWVRAGKAPLRQPGGPTLGVLGMYEVLDAETGRRLYMQQARRPPAPSPLLR